MAGGVLIVDVPHPGRDLGVCDINMQQMVRPMKKAGEIVDEQEWGYI